MRKSKVALDLQPCLSNRSGIGMYTYELAKHIHDTEHLTFSGNVFNFDNRKNLDTLLDGVTIPIHECSVLPAKIYRRLPKPFAIPYDWLFPPADLSLFFNYVVPKRISGKVVLAVHDMAYMRFPETLQSTNLLNLRMNVARGIERADRILTISEFSKKEIHELLQVPLDKISIIYPAASISENTVPQTELCAKFEIKKPYILFVGNIEPRKNLTRVLQAFDLLKREQGIPHQLVLAGGQGWKNEEIHATVQTLFSEKDIVFTGYVSDAEKTALYQSAEALVFPSLYEGFGIPPLEAMHFGCPVVCSNAASLPEVCGDAAAMVDAYQVESIASGLWRVLSDESYRNELIRKGYQQEKRFSYKDSAQKLIQLCQDVLEN